MDWPEDTVGAVFHRDGPDQPWRLHTLYRGDARRTDCYAAGWNADHEANLYSLIGSGPGGPWLDRLAEPDPEHNAVWSSIDWRSGTGMIVDGTYREIDVLDPATLGYAVLDTLPDIPLTEVEELVYCTECDEESPVEGEGTYCGHVWWCNHDGVWRGAHDQEYPTTCDEPECATCRWRDV